jgi:hypothetical protein
MQKQLVYRSDIGGHVSQETPSSTASCDLHDPQDFRELSNMILESISKLSGESFGKALLIGLAVLVKIYGVIQHRSAEMVYRPRPYKMASLLPVKPFIGAEAVGDVGLQIIVSDCVYALEIEKYAAAFREVAPVVPARDVKLAVLEHAPHNSTE